MTRTILTALDAIEENVKFIRQQLETDPGTLNAVAGFHGAQEILRTHAVSAKPELPDVLRNKIGSFFHKLHSSEYTTPVNVIRFDEITEEGSVSKETDSIYLHLARLTKDAGLQGAALSFEDLSEVEWHAFQDMYQTAMRDLRKKTVEVPELMVSYFTSHRAEGEQPQFVVAAFAYQHLLNDTLSVNQFLDEVCGRMNQERLSDGTVFDGFMVSCPELEQYQTWAILTGGFPQGANQAAQNTPIAQASAFFAPAKSSVLIVVDGTTLDTVHYEGNFDTWVTAVQKAAHAVQIEMIEAVIDFKYVGLTDELRQKLTGLGIEVKEIPSMRPLDILSKNTPTE